MILQQLSLYDLRLEEYKADFRIPFVVEVSDDLLVGRYAPPGFCDLERETYLDPDTGEETDRGPADSIVLNDDETRNFKAFVSHLGNLLRSLRARKSDWPFLDIALNYYIKAYFDFGVEQLLWYIVVLEALLGEKAEGLTERLARRLGLILGRTEKERREIRRQFRELYEFRCNLVHGNLFRKEIYHEHLDIARNLARKALIWFLNYLGNIQSKLSQHQFPENVPTREELLKLMDFEQCNRVLLGKIMQSLPDEFPYIREWRD